MIHSKLILDIFDLMADGYEFAGLLLGQIPHLTEAKFDHTGLGLFVTFSHNSEVESYRILADFNGTTKKEGVNSRLNGVEMRNEALGILADADIVLTNGIVDYLEVFNKIGEDFPLEIPKNYELHQIWLGPAKARVIKR